MTTYDYTTSGKGRKVKSGRPPGIPAHNRALSHEDVLSMRIFRSMGWSLEALGSQFGIGKVSAGAVCRGETYREVGGPITKRYSVYAKRGRKWS